MTRWLTLFALLLASDLVSQPYYIKNWGPEDGLPQSQVFCLLNDQKGYLWAGTFGGGITRFDGENFQNYSASQGLAGQFIFELQEDQAGNILIGTDKGLSIFNGREFRNYSRHLNDQPLQVIAICQQENKLWIGTNKGLYIYSSLGVQSVFQEEIGEKYIFSLLTDSAGQVWIGTDQGLYCSSPGKSLTRYGPAEGLSFPYVRHVTQLPDGSLYVATYGGGTYLFDGSRFSQIPVPAPLALHLTGDGKGDLWIATLNQGLAHWSAADSTWFFISENEGLSNNHIRSLQTDREGNLWIGTSGGGLGRFTGSQFIHYTTRQGLPGNFIYSVLEDNNGELWIGAGDQGLTRMIDGKFILINEDSGFVSTKVRALCKDTGSTMWIGTEGKGLYKFDGISYQEVTGTGSKFIRSIYKDSKNSLWVSSSGGGVTRFLELGATKGRTNFSDTWNSRNNFPSDRVNCFWEDSKGRIWMGSEGQGLIRMADTSVVQITVQDGLPDNNIRSIISDVRGNLWIATAGGGLAYFDPSIATPVFTTVRSPQIISNNIYFLAFDDVGRLVVGTEAGLSRLTLNEESRIISTENFAGPEGFPGIETCQNAVSPASGGGLWVGTIKGLVLFRSAALKNREYIPSVHFTGLDLSYKPLEETAYHAYLDDQGGLKGEPRFNYHENHFTFHFHSVSLSNPGRVLYRWKLVGFDQDWSPPSYSTQVTYSNLPPGNYDFQVTSGNEVGWSDAARGSFEISPPFWSTWWFRFLVAGTGILLIGGLFYLRLHFIKRKINLEKKRLEMERHFLELEQKALHLQMNPHFIFNALNSIQSLIGNRDEKEARLYLGRFSTLMRKILETSRKEKIPLSEEIQLLETYLQLEKLVSARSFTWQINLTNIEDTEEVFIPPMMVQPFLENSIIHGIRNSNREGVIDIEFNLTGDLLECIITDNGVGRKKAAESKDRNGQPHQSLAFTVTSERLKILNDRNGEQNPGIFDLYDETGEAAGTRVILKLPANS